ncbi:MAG: nucleoid-associated protein [Negativicutes bacterium]|nr:nucleoid-associated protein [Negativicutes bacterium]
MLTIINKAILHVLDFHSGVTVFSEQELDSQNASVATFLTKHVEKLYSDSNAQSGLFYPDSDFKGRLTAYLDGSLDFTAFSVYVGEQVYSVVSLSEILDPADLIVCDLSIEGERFLAVLKCNNKVGFTHQVVTADGMVRNDIINHYAILPSITQKLDEYALIDLNSLQIRFGDKKRSIDGEDIYIIPEKILECSSSISPKKAIDLVNTIARKVSENHGQNAVSSVAAVSKAKNYLVENAEVSDYLNPVELGRRVFSSSPMMQDEYIKEVQQAGIPETVKVDRALAEKKGKSHKIKTDTGIELAFPADYFQNTDYIEFINNPDGTLSIQLKNIGKIVNS